MRIAKNSNDNIIKCQDIENGIIKSNEYFCTKCNNVLFFVSSSERNCSYFRHKNNEECVYYVNNKNYKKYQENVMSDFHRNWQEIFPNENIEYKITRDNVNHYADIYISKNSSFNICDIFNINKGKLVIEIQNSPIDYITLQERDKHYITSDTNLLWIFNIKDKFILEKIILFDETVYKLRLTGKHYFTEIFKFNKNPNILLDGGGIYLYQITNIPDYDKELLQIKRISRKVFLEEISDILSKEILNISPIIKTKCKIYDYENTIIRIGNISNESIDKLRYIFYVLENVPFCVLKDMFNKHIEKCYINDERWLCNNCNFDNNYWNVDNCFKCKYQKPFNMYNLIYITSLLSNRNVKILDLLINFFDKNKVSINTKINFGKYNGESLENIPIEYLRWLLDNNNKYCTCKKNKCKECKSCKLNEDINQILNYSSSEVSSLFMSCYEHEGGREFDYIFTDFIKIYNKIYNKSLLLHINNSLGDEELKIRSDIYKIDKYSFIDD